ncbi:MAG: hypothetical protein JXJ04_20195 [Spirochaetales bacterium]|nr:hypothetical protein [Spirochaetales bacterium]
MSKNSRGKGIIEKYKRGRGICPICKRTGVKVIKEKEIDKQKVEICKICVATLTKKETLLKKQARAAETHTKVVKETITENNSEATSSEVTSEET